MRSVSVAQQRRMFMRQWRRNGSLWAWYIPALQSGDGLADGYTYDQIRDVVLNSNGDVANSDTDAYRKKQFRYIPKPLNEKRRFNKGSLLNDANDLTIFVLPEDGEKLSNAWRIEINSELYRIQQRKQTGALRDGAVAITLIQ